MGQWHDYRRAWPIDDQHQLVTAQSQKERRGRLMLGRRRVTVAVFGDDLQWHFVRSQDKQAIHLKVLAWQPIPEPYRPSVRGRHHP